MRRETGWHGLGRTVAELLKSLDPDLRGCSAGTDAGARTGATIGRPDKKPAGRMPPWPGTPTRWPGRH